MEADLVDLMTAVAKLKLKMGDFWQRISEIIGAPHNHAFLLSLLWKRSNLLGHQLRRGDAYDQLNRRFAYWDYKDPYLDAKVHSVFGVFDEYLVVDSFYEDGFATSVRPIRYRLRWNEHDHVYEIYDLYSAAFPVASVNKLGTLHKIDDLSWALSLDGMDFQLEFDLNLYEANQIFEGFRELQENIENKTSPIDFDAVK